MSYGFVLGQSLWSSAVSSDLSHGRELTAADDLLYSSRCPLPLPGLDLHDNVNLMRGRDRGIRTKFLYLSQSKSLAVAGRRPVGQTILPKPSVGGTS